MDYVSDTDIPSHTSDDGIPLRLDDFWASVFRLRNADLSAPRYANLANVVKAALTCFNGPKLEGSFTIMNFTATESRPRLAVQTLSTCISAQYRQHLLGDAVCQYHVPRPQVTPLPPKLVKLMATAWHTRLNEQRSRRLIKKLLNSSAMLDKSIKNGHGPFKEKL